MRKDIKRIVFIKKERTKIEIPKAMAFVGKGNCGKKDVSIHHDDYLAKVKN